MANSCEEWQFRCNGCPGVFLEEETAIHLSEIVDKAVTDPSYAHLRSASAGEIVGMAEQSAEQVGDKALAGLVAGALGLIATNRCKRN